jgi:hypothetical protein
VGFNPGSSSRLLQDLPKCKKAAQREIKLGECRFKNNRFPDWDWELQQKYRKRFDDYVWRCCPKEKPVDDDDDDDDATVGRDAYWIIMNSWGTGWGDGGFAKLPYKADRIGYCGMYREVTLPKVQ